MISEFRWVKIKRKSGSILLDNQQYDQEYKKKMAEIEYQKSIAELEKLNLEIENMDRQSDNYKKILLENGIEISVRHTSKNLKMAPLQEMVQYNQ